MTFYGHPFVSDDLQDRARDTCMVCSGGFASTGGIVWSHSALTAIMKHEIRDDWKQGTLQSAVCDGN